MTVVALERDLGRIVGVDGILPGDSRAYVRDATEARGLRGRAEAVVLPRATHEVARVLAWCSTHDVPVVPRGGGTGFAGGAVPVDGGVVLALERMQRIRSFEPLLWRVEVESGLTTAEVRRVARENGLLFPPDPGAAEQSQIGGNIATNAGGPHAFKYGVTGAWVSGLEAVLVSGDVVTVGGPVRKDVAGYDLKSLLVGSEGTLAVVTAAWLKLLPAPESALPVAAFYEGAEPGCDAILRVLGSGITAAALEYLDGGTLGVSRAAFPSSVPASARFLVLAEADGSEHEAARTRDELIDVLSEESVAVHTPIERAEVEAVWRWRDGVSIAVEAKRGGKVSEDIAVPLEHLAEAIGGTLEIGDRHGLEALSWGHAGDGNLHSTFLVAPDDREELERAERAVEDLFRLAVALGGTISGEHGLGLVKQPYLSLQHRPAAIAIQTAIKRAFDPNGLLNPGKKLPAAR